jgi:5-methylcytosine-specific restriction endonuclease McrA
MSSYSDYECWKKESVRMIRDNWGNLSPAEIRELIIKKRSEYPPNEKRPYSVPTPFEILSIAYHGLHIVDSDEYRKWYGIYARRPMSPRKKQAIKDRDNNRCVFCGSDERLEVDHIIAVSIGGTNDDSNLQTLCKKCNRAKGRNDITLDHRWLRR